MTSPQKGSLVALALGQLGHLAKAESARADAHLDTAAELTALADELRHEGGFAKAEGGSATFHHHATEAYDHLSAAHTAQHAGDTATAHQHLNAALDHVAQAAHALPTVTGPLHARAAHVLGTLTLHSRNAHAVISGLGAERAAATMAKAPPAEPATHLAPAMRAQVPRHAPDAHLTPPAGPKLAKQPGETGEQAISRHLSEHDAHLTHLETRYGMHTPRGHATVMMGLPGSGKSHYLKGHHMSQGTHVHVDVDALKHLSPGEHDYVYPKHYPEGHAKSGQAHPRAGQLISHYDESNPVHVAAAHPVSKRLEEHMFKQAAQKKLPLALDTTGGNHSKWAGRMQGLREHGYHQVNLANVRVTKETSMARNAGRKRTVPQSVIDGTLAEHDRHSPGNHGKTPFEHLSAHADKVHVVDHESPEGQHKRAAAGWHSYLSSEKATKMKAGGAA